MLEQRKPERVSAEMIAHVLKGLREDLLPSSAPQPKPKIEAEILPFPPILCEQQLQRRQHVIDAMWERVQAARQKLEAEARQCCHVGPDDLDSRLR